eukprot:338472-Chlamydomonas_euryale.AAC.1
MPPPPSSSPKLPPRGGGAASSKGAKKAAAAAAAAATAAAAHGNARWEAAQRSLQIDDIQLERLHYLCQGGRGAESCALTIFGLFRPWNSTFVPDGMDWVDLEKGGEAALSIACAAHRVRVRPC